ncbi:hypothetical protein V2I94_06690 [Pseudomonas viridiflava]|nr:hypothetical protein [Pseudomonas viridiflava]
MGADLSAKRPVHPTRMQWLKYGIRGQVRSHEFAARQRYVEDVVAPPTKTCSFSRLSVVC